MIELINVSKRYRYRRQTVDVLNNVNLKIKKGECVCIRAPSGTGKTTLLNIIGGMLAPTRSSVMQSSCRRVPAKRPSRGLPTAIPMIQPPAEYRRNNVGFVFQQFNLLDNLTVMDNLFLPLVPTGKTLKTEKGRISKLLEKLQISHRYDFEINYLSGGEQQRVAVARALVNDPEIIIADEPFSNLDEGNTRFILDIFRELKARGKTFVISATSPRSDLEEGFIDRDIPNDHQ